MFSENEVKKRRRWFFSFLFNLQNFIAPLFLRFLKDIVWLLRKLKMKKTEEKSYIKI